MPCSLSSMKTGKRSGANRRGSCGSTQHRLPRDMQAADTSGQQGPHPGAGRDDRRAGLDRAALGRHPHAAALRLDREDPLAGQEFRARRTGKRAIAADRGFGFKKSAIGLHHADEIDGQMECGIARHHVARVQHLMPQIVQARRGERALTSTLSGARFRRCR